MVFLETYGISEYVFCISTALLCLLYGINVQGVALRICTGARLNLDSKA